MPVQVPLVLVALLGFLGLPVQAAVQAAPPRVVDFRAARWDRASGGDGLTRAIVVVEQPWSWHDANALALQLGASLAKADSPAALSFLEFLSDHPGAFDCGGPWLGGFRDPQGAWRWADGLPVQVFGWRPFRPAQSIVFESAIMMSGIDGPDGRWTDAFPDPDAGVATRAALVAWTSFADCDQDGLPDLLEIARDPALDANADGALDSCSPPNRSDLNGDGRVDAIDIAVLLNAWGTSDAAADIDGSGSVGGSDLAILLNDWTGD